MKGKEQDDSSHSRFYTGEEMDTLEKLANELKMVADGEHPTSLFSSAHKLPATYNLSLLPDDIRNDNEKRLLLENFLLSSEVRQCNLKRCNAVPRGFLAIMVCFPSCISLSL